MKIKSSSIKQKGRLDDIGIYLTKITALDLIERCSIDRWTIDNTKGY